MPWHPYLNPTLVQSDLTRPIKTDPFGHRLHLAFALLFCFSIPGPMILTQFAGIPLIIFFLLRTPHIWRTWGSFAVQPLFLAVVAFTAWQALAILWSSNPDTGLDELSDRRWVWAMWMLWPMMMHRPLLIAAIIAGFFAANLAQLTHEIGLRANLSSLTFDRLPGRNSGWWQPVVGGTMLVGALGLHLPAAVMGRGTQRLLAIGGSLITLLAIFATGSRGAWIAATALLLLTFTIAIARRALAHHRATTESRRGTTTKRTPRFAPALALTLAILAAGTLGWFAVGETVIRRTAEARMELTRAQDGDYTTWTGARLLMLSWAADAFQEHPIRGIGAGAYRNYAAERLAERDDQQNFPHVYLHAHNAPLHIAATKGIIGLALAVLVIFLAIRGGLRELDHPPRRNWSGGLGSYNAGPAFAIIGLVFASMTDVIHLNAQTSAFLTVLLGLCLISRPHPPAKTTDPAPPTAAAATDTIAAHTN